MIRPALIFLSAATILFLAACESDQDQKPHPEHHQFGYDRGTTRRSLGPGAGDTGRQPLLHRGHRTRNRRADCASATPASATFDPGQQRRPGDHRYQRRARNGQARLPVRPARPGGGGEIIRPHSRIEAIQAEVNGIRAILDRRPGALPIARRREQFRARQGRAGFFRRRGLPFQCCAVRHAGQLTRLPAANQTMTSLSFLLSFRSLPP